MPSVTSRALDQPKSADDVQKVKQIKEKLIKTNPTQRALQIDPINRIIAGSSAIVNIKLPKGPKKKNSRGRPRGATNKPKEKANKTTEEAEDEEEQEEEDTPKETPNNKEANTSSDKKNNKKAAF
ncbi:hypothetical protein PSTT_03671 [Puccinia striiformis]|uniref:Uncharacterized protein n=1 Tax=Puccinia striiformis TaxID=27350 RepID=A0A2S4VVE0_9BASI|nr:hypothetical protein PSTT_03671 [Puccinia striiformis]